VVVRSGRERLVGRRHRVTPLPSSRRVLSTTHGIDEPGVPGEQGLAEPVEGCGRARQPRAKPVQIVDGGEEVTAVGLASRIQPLTDRVLDWREVAMADAALPEPDRRFAGGRGVARLQCRSCLNQPETRQSLTQLGHAFRSRVQRFGCEKVFPGRTNIVAIQRSARSCAVAVRDIAGCPPGLPIALLQERRDQTVGVIGAAIRHRFRRLPQY
jgi:hypothetical protein